MLGRRNGQYCVGQPFLPYDDRAAGRAAQRTPARKDRRGSARLRVLPKTFARRQLCVRIHHQRQVCGLCGLYRFFKTQRARLAHLRVINGGGVLARSGCQLLRLVRCNLYRLELDAHDAHLALKLFQLIVQHKDFVFQSRDVGQPHHAAGIVPRHQRCSAHHHARARAGDHRRALVVRHLRDALAHCPVQLIHPHEGARRFLHRVQHGRREQVAAVGRHGIERVDIALYAQFIIDHSCAPPFARLS